MKRRNFIKNICSLCIGLASFPLHSIYAKENDTPSIDVQDYLQKMEQFDSEHASDIYLEASDIVTAKQLLERLNRLEKTVGNANFTILNFDTARTMAKNYSFVGAFTQEETLFFEKLFYADVSIYGFLGTKILHNFTETISKKELIKIPAMGNYLYGDASYKKWCEIQKHVDKKVLLTSGVRSIIKQSHLFLRKLIQYNNNLSLASRSIAPPAYSFHSIGDFDIGHPSLGKANFTQEFLKTDTYKFLSASGFLALRYYNNNSLGVRFEPWHVKV